MAAAKALGKSNFHILRSKGGAMHNTEIAEEEEDVSPWGIIDKVSSSEDGLSSRHRLVC